MEKADDDYNYGTFSDVSQNGGGFVLVNRLQNKERIKRKAIKH